MYPGITGKSWRLGDLAGGGSTTVGPHIGQITSMEPAKTKDGDEQIKFVAKLYDGGAHTWYRTLSENAIWTFANDLLAAGADSNVELMNPPNAAQYIAAFQQGFVGRVFEILVTQKAGSDFLNTKLVRVVQVGPDGMPIGAGTPTSPSGPAHGAPAENVPQQVAPPAVAPGMSFGGPAQAPVVPQAQAAPFGAPPAPAGFPPASASPFGGAPAAPGNVTDLFRRG